MDKVERLISIIMILLKKDIVATTEFAQLFQVSKRTILRDMETLSLSNIPIYAIHGVNGGYGIMEEYKVDKRLLSTSDLENILTALGGLGAILDSPDIEQTVKKIEAMVTPLPLQHSIHWSFYNWEGRSEIVPTLRTCQQSIAKKKLLTFDYIDKNGTVTNRVVEPYQLHFNESSWYVVGFCLHRMQFRTFKLSRIDHLAMDERTFTPREYRFEQERQPSGQPQLVEVKALIAPSIKDQFIERYGRTSMENYSSDLLLATMHVPRDRAGFQFIASFGTNLTLVEPACYVEEFRNYLRQMMDNYT